MEKKKTDLAVWVLHARTTAKLTQTELGELLHVTKGNVSAWENGRHEPSYGQVQCIASLTKVPAPNQPGRLAPDVLEALDAAPDALRQQLENMLRAALGIPIPQTGETAELARNAPSVPRAEVTQSDILAVTERGQDRAPQATTENVQWDIGSGAPRRVGRMKREDVQKDHYPRQAERKAKEGKR